MSENIFIKPVTHSSTHEEASPPLSADFPSSIQFVTLPSAPLPAVTFRDVDKDGDLDIVIHNPAPGQSNWVENRIGEQGDKIFQNPIFSKITPTTMVSGDLDGDGNLDVVIGHISGVKIFYSHDNWSMSDLGIKFSTPRSILLDDVTGDGETDILVRDSNNLTLLENTQGHFGIHSMSWPDLGDHNLLTIANFDLSSPEKEILVYNSQTSHLGLIAHAGNTWNSFQTLTSVNNPRVILQDVNNDGSDDIYVEDDNGTTILFESNGNGEITLQGNQVTHLPLEESDVPEADNDVPESYDDSTEEASEDWGESGLSVSLSERAPMPAPSLSADDAVEKSAFFNEAPAEEGEDIAQNSLRETHTLTEIEGTNRSDLIFGNDEAEHIEGHLGNDIIFGNDGDDVIDGGDGADLLWGDSGDDVLNGNKGNDIIFGGSGDDSINGNKGSDLIFGDEGDDILHGGSGDDILFGDSGDDTIHGDQGSDYIFGGSGNDVFFYDNPKEGNDLILDYEQGKDSFHFTFGTSVLFDATDDTNGMEGDGFVWESTQEGCGSLYYDPDLTVADNELLIAHVELTEDDTTLTVDDITIT